jgi:ATP-dependent helicase/nuclease subunit A
VTALNPQIVASDPKVSAFVTANAGSGKTRTLVDRVARLLLRGVKPETVLCVTYTKAAAAEMQRRLFERLGGWAVAPDDRLRQELAEIDEQAGDLGHARALFAAALETPGGLRIQTLHAFCEKLLKRFPLEAGVAPGFEVLDEQAAREVSAQAREDLAEKALEDPDGLIGRAYERFSVELHYRAFHEMFATFEAVRGPIKAYAEACRSEERMEADVWRRCAFAGPTPSAELEAEAVAGTDWAALGRAREALLGGSVRDQALGAELAATPETASFDGMWRAFCTKDGKPLANLATKQIAPAVRDWLKAEQGRLEEACGRIKAARVAEDSLSALVLAIGYAKLYDGAKDESGGLDFGDLIQRTHELLTARADAAWVLYKLDGGIDHVLVDEAQDTAPNQWDIVRALTGEFFAGVGAGPAGRSMFAVGDEKQSIFSFQGADPTRFIDERGEYESQVRGAGLAFRSPSLLQSYRSAPEVLEFVDAVCSDPGALAALRPEGGSEPIRHVATRPAGRGLVELWTLEKTDRAAEVDAWDAPVDADPPESGNKRLARRIAGDIKAMVARGEAVFERDPSSPGGERPRPMGYGDVLILVRRRGALFHEIIRALKQAKVPVGGADRLTLSEHIVFHDLVALARFCLFPQDDLNLAALLRSPLFDVDEESLYLLARGRTRRLWGELVARSGERREWSAARELLDRIRQEGRSRPPFDFYARLLNLTDADGRSLRARITTRLGREADEAIDAFLAEALKAERRGMRELESFCADMAQVDVEVKREQEEGKGEVRVMTVHGAKGLEAPVVILPDTTVKASVQGGPLLDSDEGFLWSARKGDDCPASAAARQARAREVDQESLRLLYVAVTRARDRLIIAGVEPGQRWMFNDSWRDLCERALANPAIADRVRDQKDGDGRALRRFGAEPLLAPAETIRAPSPSPLPDWAARAAPREPAQQRWAAPSQITEAIATRSPSPSAAVDGLGRFRRGDLIHRLLQLLPDVEPARRREAGLRLLEKERDLTGEQRVEMIAAALGVLEDETFAAVFGPGSRAEVAIAGAAPELPAGLAVSGRIDRLLVEPGRVLVADFKTNRPSPDRIEDADEAYIAQMAVYAAVLRQVFPGRRVEAALVWTDGPKLMNVPENLMAQALQALPRSG